MARNMLVGFIASERCKPMLTLRTFEGVSFTGTVDTGFNGQLLLDQATARVLGVEMTGERSTVLLTGGVRGEIQIGGLTIDWFGTLRYVDATVLESVPEDPRLVPFPPSESEILIGTMLMHPGRLTIDFLEETVHLAR